MISHGFVVVCLRVVVSSAYIKLLDYQGKHTEGRSKE
jgi:hypothetical protein